MQARSGRRALVIAGLLSLFACACRPASFDDLTKARRRIDASDTPQERDAAPEVVDDAGTGERADSGGRRDSMVGVEDSMVGMDRDAAQAADASTDADAKTDAAPGVDSGHPVDGASGVCVPSDTQCASPTAQRICNAFGQWADIVVCEHACVNDRCGGECVPGARSCANDVARVCTAQGAWQDESACSGATPLCVGAGECRCRPGTIRCDGTQPQVCDASNNWVQVGAPCADCKDGQCFAEGCDATTRSNCGGFGCGCVDNACSGAYCDGDGCTGARRTACAALGCGCVDGRCEGGFCAGPGCTAKRINDCSAFGCNCALTSCVGGACQ